MKLAALVVLYNPQKQGLESVIKNIKSYSSHCEKIYLVDNSKNDNSIILKYIENAEYLSNKNVNGIAGAQNMGCQKALSEGFEWLMTMDQDSVFDEEQIQRYLKEVEKIVISQNEKKIKSFTLNIKMKYEMLPPNKWIRLKILSPIKRKVLGKKWHPRPFQTGYSIVKKCIASANIINLHVWKQVGGFDNQLFIDEVDFDFCFKISKLGYNIAKIRGAEMEHAIGEKHFSIIPRKLPYENEFRMFYIFRNHYIIMDRYPEHREDYEKELKRWIFNFCINTIHPIAHFRILIKARNAFNETKNNSNLSETKRLLTSEELIPIKKSQSD